VCTHPTTTTQDHCHHHNHDHHQQGKIVCMVATAIIFVCQYRYALEPQALKQKDFFKVNVTSSLNLMVAGQGPTRSI
jgi:hypothetical protein